MSSPAAQSGPLLALLRAIVFVGVTESICYRLLPDPGSPGLPAAIGSIHESINRAGGMAFFIAFVLVTVALAGVAARAVRRTIWPAGLNGFMAACLLCVAAMGFTALTTDKGPAFAIAFTLIAFVALVCLAMHAFCAGRPPAERAFAVLYCGTMACGTASVVLRFAARIAAGRDAGTALVPVRRLLDASGTMLTAGHALLVASAVAGFLAFATLERPDRPSRRRFVAAAALAGAMALGFAAACRLAPQALSPLGPRSGLAAIVLISWALFLAALTAMMNLFDPNRRALGYGLALIVLAGFPPRIAYQDMIMLLGAVFVLGPRVRPAPALLEVVLAPRPPDPPSGGPPRPLPAP